MAAEGLRSGFDGLDDELEASLAEEERLWGGAGPDGDGIVEAIECLRREDARRKEHARLSGHTAVQEVEAVESLLVPGLQRGLDGLNDGTYVDGTFGRGGHSRSILRRLSDRGRLYAFDVDPTAVDAGRQLEREDARFRIFHRPFGELDDALAGVQVDGVLLDIGVSNPQVDEDERGFKFTSDTPLDLRMNQQQGVTAAEWLRSVSVEELAWVIHAYGEHKDPLLAERIAESVLARQRRLGPYVTARELADVVKLAKGVSDRSMHPAKLTFQAIRIFLNHELDQLRSALQGAFQRLAVGGRCVVITFKSLETDVVVGFVHEHEDPPPEVARTVSAARLCELYPLTGQDTDFCVQRLCVPFRPRGAEYINNPRSRSSSLITLLKASRWSRRVLAQPRAASERLQRPMPPPFLGGTTGSKA